MDGPVVVAGIGALAAAVGGVLVIGTTILSALRPQFTVPTKAFFVAQMDKLADGTKFKTFMGLAPGIKAAYDDVRAAMYKPDFWLVSWSEAEQLRAVGLEADDVRQVTQGWDHDLAGIKMLLERPKY